MTKGNSQQHDRIWTQNWGNTTSRLLAVREAAQMDKHQQLISLFHHINEALLLQSFRTTVRRARHGDGSGID